MDFGLICNRIATGCKWVLRLKKTEMAPLTKYKAWMVAKCFNQIPGWGYSETFSLVANPVIVGILLAIALTFSQSIHQIDVNKTFLNGYFEEKKYMAQPPGIESSNNQQVCTLNTTIYGLRDIMCLV